MIMAGLGILIYSLLAGAAAIGRGIENEKVKSQTYKIDEKGRPTYMDRNGKHYINGERIIPEYDYQQHYTRYVGQRTGTVYIDPERERREKHTRENEERKQKAIKDGKLAYEKYDNDWQRQITTEISTGKPIAILNATTLGCYKQYASEEKPPWKGCFYVNQTMAIGEKIPITYDEFCKLNIIGGSHYCYEESGVWRYYYNLKKKEEASECSDKE